MSTHENAHTNVRAPKGVRACVRACVRALPCAMRAPRTRYVSLRRSTTEAREQDARPFAAAETLTSTDAFCSDTIKTISIMAKRRKRAASGPARVRAERDGEKGSSGVVREGALAKKHGKEGGLLVASV